jgi:hypothetical protein
LPAQAGVSLGAGAGARNNKPLIIGDQSATAHGGAHIP